MSLGTFNFAGRTAYRFSELDERLPENLYAFVGIDLDVKPFKGQNFIEIDEYNRVALVNQTHTSIVVDCSAKGIEADGIIVNEGEIAGVMTADCTPVIIYSEEKKIGAVIHCGWLGTFSEIVQVAVKKLIEKDVIVENSFLLIGPAAQECCYEVQVDFIHQLKLLEKDWFNRPHKAQSLPNYIHRNGKYYASIPNLIYNIALQLGFAEKNIFKASECTICDERFFSHRRQGSLAGRQLSILNLRNAIT